MSRKKKQRPLEITPVLDKAGEAIYNLWWEEIQKVGGPPKGCSSAHIPWQGLAVKDMWYRKALFALEISHNRTIV